MKAIQLRETGEPEVMQYKTTEAPQPHDEEVLIRIHAIGVNPVDTYIRSGNYSIDVSMPYTPGWECAGEVEAVGRRVTGVQVGDRVYTTRTLSGAYAERCTAHVDFVHALPSEIEWATGAAVGIAYGTAYRALFQNGGAKPGQWVLVHGASGAVGQAAVQLASARGISVIGTASSERGREAVLKSGASFVVNHQDEDHLQEALTLANIRGFDLIVEMAAHINLQHNLAVMAPGGVVLVVGSRGTLTLDPRGVMGTEASIRGVMLYGANAMEREQMHAAIYAGLDNGTLKPEVAKTYSLSDAAQAHRDITSGLSKSGKLVLLPETSRQR